MARWRMAPQTSIPISQLEIRSYQSSKTEIDPLEPIVSTEAAVLHFIFLALMAMK